ncbi:Uncharacterised protein [Starkeya nomas]|uniref:Uncharacterized protein n=1 Tax=Starkeya nomas TaxID=2666134 RepID=A0A5S9N9U6_9HYPH|nr:PAAR domain-containing protein [Starkeya nomas]CAA0086865.1 Uncharacterised protein [Starkeya nomas]
MPGIAVKGLDSAGGLQLAGGQDWVTVEGQLVVVLGDPVEPHGFPPHAPTPTMAEGSDWFSIDGTPVCRAGHRATCGHASTGRGWFLIDE